MDTATPPYNAAPAPNSAQDPRSEAAQDAARTDRNLHILDEMIEAGVELVRRTRATLEVTDNQQATFAQAERCARLVRAVERAVALSAWIIRDRRLAATHHTRHQAEAAETRRTDRQKHLNHVMGQAIAAAPREKSPGLLRRYQFRVNDWDIQNDLTHHSVEAAITRLCTELGIPQPAPASPTTAPDTTPPPDTPPEPAVTIPRTLAAPSAAANARFERILALHDPP